MQSQHLEMLSSYIKNKLTSGCNKEANATTLSTAGTMTKALISHHDDHHDNFCCFGPFPATAAPPPPPPPPATAGAGADADSDAVGAAGTISTIHIGDHDDDYYSGCSESFGGAGSRAQRSAQALNKLDVGPPQGLVPRCVLRRRPE